MIMRSNSRSLTFDPVHGADAEAGGVLGADAEGFDAAGIKGFLVAVGEPVGAGGEADSGRGVVVGVSGSESGEPGGDGVDLFIESRGLANLGLDAVGEGAVAPLFVSAGVEVVDMRPSRRATA